MTKTKKHLEPLLAKNDGMSPALQKLWIKALRSERFKRGNSVLCQRESSNYAARYCPLGVLVEVLIKKGFPIKKSKTIKAIASPFDNDDILMVHPYTYKKQSFTSLLTDKLADDIGLPHETQLEIALLNDSISMDDPKGHIGLQKIATVIENHELFMFLDKEDDK